VTTSIQSFMKIGQRPNVWNADNVMCCRTTWCIHTLQNNVMYPHAAEKRDVSTRCRTTLCIHTLQNNVMYPHAAKQRDVSTRCRTTWCIHTLQNNVMYPHAAEKTEPKIKTLFKSLLIPKIDIAPTWTLNFDGASKTDDLYSL